MGVISHLKVGKSTVYYSRADFAQIRYVSSEKHKLFQTTTGDIDICIFLYLKGIR